MVATPTSWGGVLTNSGTIQTQVEGTQLDYLEADLVNNGTVRVQSGELRQDDNTTTTNNATFLIGSGASAGYTLTTASDLFVNNMTGAVSNGGAVTLSGGASWDQAGGSESGDPVTMYSGALTDDGHGASGLFDLLDNVTFAGTVASGETLDLTGVPGHNAALTLNGEPATNEGMIIMDSQSGGGYALLEDGTLTNSGTIQTQVEGTQLDYLEADLVNNGTVRVQSGELRQDDNTTTTNNGDVVLDSSSEFNLTTTEDVFKQQSGGILTFQIASTAVFGTLNLTNGAVFQLSGGTADPVLASGYDPAVGTEYDVIAGTWGSGAFMTVESNFTGDYAHTTFAGLIRARDSTPTTVASSANPSTSGKQVTFTATVTPGPNGRGNPTGAVTFYDNGTSIGTAAVSTTGGITTATLTTSTLSAGNPPDHRVLRR